jgi:hypothetical protein
LEDWGRSKLIGGDCHRSFAFRKRKKKSGPFRSSYHFQAQRLRWYSASMRSHSWQLNHGITSSVPWASRLCCLIRLTYQGAENSGVVLRLLRMFQHSTEQYPVGGKLRLKRT